ncbi:MAG: tetratricopeptide (TPR) repeat protein [Planctomycetota bacterium]|jgi:tetratricopeptide (TPR) repeat protein
MAGVQSVWASHTGTQSRHPLRIFALLLPLLTTPTSTALEPLAGGSWSRAEDAQVSGLTARCLWAESGWQSVIVGLAESAPESSVDYSLEVLAEHARLHGWSSEIGEGTHPLVTEIAKCPPAALAELNRTERTHLNGKQIVAIGSVARALAENGYVDRAVSMLDQLRGQALPIRSESRMLWQAARLHEAAGNWQSALDYLEVLDSTRHWNDLAINRVRAHCYYELEQTEQLENLIFSNLTSDPSCHSLELLIQAWKRSRSSNGLPQLLEGCLQTVRDASAQDRIRAEITKHFEAAVLHLQILSLSPADTADNLTELLAGGDHHREAGLTLQHIGPQSINSIRERAKSLPADELQLIHELHRVLAESGLAQVEDAIKAIDESSGGFPYLSIWKAAHALRRDLSASQSATPASTR